MSKVNVPLELLKREKIPGNTSETIRTGQIPNKIIDLVSKYARNGSSSNSMFLYSYDPATGQSLKGH